MAKEKDINTENVEDTEDKATTTKKAKGDKKTEKLKADLLAAEERATKAEEEAAAANDKYLRLAAEYDNYRKRSTKEREAVYTDAFTDAVAAFLPLMDSIGLAQQFAEADDELSKGVRMLQKQIEDILKKLNVEEIASDGQQFDPMLHNAVMHEEDDTSPENTVKQTFQKGYRIGDKVIRHAMVTVVN